MATIDLNDILRVVAEWSAPQATVSQLTWHYKVISGTNDDPADVLDDIVTKLQTAWADINVYVSDEWEGNTIELFKYDDGNHRWDGVANKALTGVSGQSTTSYMPHGCSVLVKAYTEVNRRQARKYFFGLHEGNHDDGAWAAGIGTAFGNFMVDILGDVSAPLTTLRFGTFNVDSASPLYETFAERTSTYTVELNPAYQRRRRPGTGV